MTSPSGAAVDAVREQVKQYFETHITDARDGAVHHLRQVEATAVDTVEGTADRVTGPHVEATRQDREATAEHVVEAGGHAQDAAASAGLAAQHAEGVSHAEARAGEHEDLARGHEDEARVQAEASAGHADRADGHATSAAGSAAAAATHEDTARQHAEAAGGHEQAAEAHAQTATTASTDALEAADRIGTAEQVGVWHDETLNARDDAYDARDEAVAAADQATTGIPDGGVTRPKLAPDVVAELEGKADQEYVDSQLAALPTEGRSLFADPSFENGTDHTAVEVPDAFSGKYVSRLNAGRWTAGGQRSMFYTGGETRTYEVVYRARAVNFPDGYTGNTKLEVRFRRLDGNREYIGEFYPPTSALLELKTLTSEWTECHAVYTVDSTHMYLAPYFVLSGNSELEGAFVDVDQVFLADVTEKEGLRTHTHTSADITDAEESSEGPASAKKLVRWGTSGSIATKVNPTSGDHLTRKGYVDQEVGKKANTSHTHTAADVGARPDTWTPTAQDVGARPDTWTPTAVQVGARPASWTPTAAQVGALPEGWKPTVEVTGDQWPTQGEPGIIYWQAES